MDVLPNSAINYSSKTLGKRTGICGFLAATPRDGSRRQNQIYKEALKNVDGEDETGDDAQRDFPRVFGSKFRRKFRKAIRI